MERREVARYEDIIISRFARFLRYLATQWWYCLGRKGVIIHRRARFVRTLDLLPRLTSIIM